MRTFSFRGFGKLVSLLPNQSASFILHLEELGNIVKIPQVVKILTIVPLLIETGIQVSHHIAGKREVNSHPPRGVKYTAYYNYFYNVEKDVKKVFN